MSADFDLDVFSTLHSGDSKPSNQQKTSSDSKTSFMLAGHNVDVSMAGTLRTKSKKSTEESKTKEKKAKKDWRPDHKKRSASFKVFSTRAEKERFKEKERLREEALQKKERTKLKNQARQEKYDEKLAEKKKKLTLEKIAERFKMKKVKAIAQNVRENDSTESKDLTLHIAKLPLDASFNDIADWLITHMKRSKFNRPAPKLEGDDEAIRVAKAKLLEEKAEEKKTTPTTTTDATPVATPAVTPTPTVTPAKVAPIIEANDAKAAELRQVGITRLRLVENLKRKFKGFGFVSFVDSEMKSSVMELYTKNVVEATRRKAVAMEKEEAKKAKAAQQSTEKPEEEKTVKKSVIPGGFATFSGLNFLLYKDREVSLQQIESTKIQVSNELDFIRKTKKEKVISRLEANREKKIQLLREAEEQAEKETQKQQQQDQKKKEKEAITKAKAEAPKPTAPVVKRIANAPQVSKSKKAPTNALFTDAVMAAKSQPGPAATPAPVKRKQQQQEEETTTKTEAAPSNVILPVPKKLRLKK